MNTTLKNIIGTICGALACVSLLAAVSVMDGSAHETAVRFCGAFGLALFATLWAKLKEEK